MNSLLARNFSKRSTSIIRSFSAGQIPTSSVAESGGFKVMGLPHLSVSSLRCVQLLCKLISDLIDLICLLFIKRMIIDTRHEIPIQEGELVE
jgi:hypothetical protein